MLQSIIAFWLVAIPFIALAHDDPKDLGVENARVVSVDLKEVLPGINTARARSSATFDPALFQESCGSSIEIAPDSNLGLALYESKLANDQAEAQGLPAVFMVRVRIYDQEPDRAGRGCVVQSVKPQDL